LCAQAHTGVSIRQDGEQSRLDVPLIRHAPAALFRLKSPKTLRKSDIKRKDIEEKLRGCRVQNFIVERREFRVFLAFVVLNFGVFNL
jgi:hypothetical protein